jgi:hypothetical protein
MKTYYFKHYLTEEVLPILAPTETKAREILKQYSNHSDYYFDRVCELEQIDSVS